MSAVAKKDEKKIIRRVLPGDLKQAEFVRSEWRVVLKEGETMEDVLQADFWSHVADKLNRSSAANQIALDHIEIIAHDRSFWAEVLVVDRGKLWAKVEVLHYKDLGGAVKAAKEKAAEKEIEDPDYTVRYHGPKKLWIIIRNSDKSELYSEIGSKDAAFTKLAEHKKTIGAAE